MATPAIPEICIDSAGTIAALLPDLATRRAHPRTKHECIAFIQPLHPQGISLHRVQLIDSSPVGLGVRASIPVAACARLVLSIARNPPMQGLFLCRVVHCAALQNNQYHIGLVILDRRDWCRDKVTFPEAWRKRPREHGRLRRS